MLRLIVWTISLILLLGIGYFSYDNWFNQSQLDTWSFVPENAAMVYETNRALEIHDETSSKILWKTLEKIEGVDNLQKNLLSLQEITNHQLTALLEKNQLLISVHNVSKNEFDFLYILEVKSIEGFQQLQNIESHFAENSFQRKTRKYLDFTITELSDGAETFAFIFYKNYLVASFSPFLVEDAIRTFSSPEYISFDQWNKELFSLTKIQEDAGNLYLNVPNTVELLQSFNDEWDLTLTESAYLDFAIDDQIIELNGFTSPIPEKPSALTPHQNIEPGAFDMGSVVPLQTSYIYHYSFGDALTWGKQYQKYLQSEDKSAVATARILKNDGDFDINSVYDLVDEEIGLLHFEGITETSKALILEVKNTEEASAFFDEIAKRFSRVNRDTLYTESFKGVELKLLPATDFPLALLGKAADGFDNSYFCAYDQFLIFTDALFLLKDIVSAIQEENTWLKSLKKNSFLQQTNQAANFSLFVNTPEFWSKLTESINPFWQSYFKTNGNLLKSLDNLAVQFSYVDGRFFTNVVLMQSDAPEFGEKLNTIRNVQMPVDLITKPYLVVNHNDGSREIMLQDSSYNLYLLDRNFKSLWTLPLSGPIVGDIFQVDYYGNNKLQYAFVAGKAFYILDREGRLLPGFPNSIANADPLKNFNVIDYDGSKRYRFSFSDGRGNVYLTDKNAKILEGWAPKSFNKSLVVPLDHERIGKRDILIALLSTGEIQILNRRSNMMSGFPKVFDVPIQAKYHLKQGADLSKSNMTIITDIGELITFNLTGDLLKREQLYKPSPTAQFDILEDYRKNQFLVTAWDERSWTVMDTDGLELFQKQYLTSTDIFQQFYRISAGKELLILGDKKAKSAYLFNLEGRLLSETPLRASQPLSVLYSSSNDVFQLFVVAENELQLIELNAGQ